MLLRLRDMLGAWLFDHTNLSAMWIFHSKMNQIEEQYGMDRGEFAEFLREWAEEYRAHGQDE